MNLDGKVLHWVPDVHMYNGHEGLAAIARKELRIKVDELKPGEFVLFMNKSFTAFKVYAANNMILHHKSPTGSRLNAKAVLQLPHFIKGQHINYDKALAHVITAEYGSRYGSKERPVEN